MKIVLVGGLSICFLSSSEYKMFNGFQRFLHGRIDGAVFMTV